ncbi:MAG: hypothetical protein IPI67_38920 [Myxococcales bacterium]|nr:hypothetical protein [Myxococcales bacterium]
MVSDVRARFGGLKRLWQASCFVWVVALPRASSAQPTSQSDAWQYRRFDWLDVGVTVAGATAVVATTFIWPPNGDVRWHGGVLFDDRVRDGLRAKSRAGRDHAQTLGDAVYFAGALYPIVVDGFVAFAIRQKPNWGVQMLLIDLEAYAVAGALLTGSERVFERGRPSLTPCETDPNYEAHCGRNDKGVGLTVASFVGVARVMAGKHFISDAVGGALVGGSTGILVPALHSTPVKVVPQLNPDTKGVAAVGRF